MLLITTENASSVCKNTCTYRVGVALKVEILLISIVLCNMMSYLNCEVGLLVLGLLFLLDNVLDLQTYFL